MSSETVRTRRTGPGTQRSGRVSLVATVSDDLRRRILEGRLNIGDRLPSEAELTRQYSVSRTVVREAIATLRYENLVEARQGAGVFVRNNQPANAAPFSQLDYARISSIIEILELRAAVEMEAAALAATRRSPAQEEAIAECYEDINTLIGAGEPTHDADMAFHLAIADATNNPRFREFLALLGLDAIPRAMLRPGADIRTPKEYLLKIQDEHRQIADAISLRDEQAARDAMRTHLIGSQQRYRARLRSGSASERNT
ncbi:FadR/GntR family transcriptional regulator [Chelativorans sp. M5D2P16]|uniref:FadR/GntR family transcriptional regulator n=1 Tax=Chelativorans sp. M5D2P16 TaxID=3095678 RepID=UPI002ACA921B|nr:FadR/GntR family transcriptional regulator [Chelativorans sp. M5D2P16]MDZ5699642.1 FadR/GntR family transcriptional regulator [Chelativorans sp. M5D2P16]